MSCVYTIEVNGLFYVGSTEDEVERIYTHNYDIIHSSTKLYVAIRANNGNYIFTVHHYSENVGKALRMEEQALMDELQPELNTIRAYNSDEYNVEYNAKYRAEHIVERAEYDAKYYTEHVVEKAEYNAKYYTEHVVERAEYDSKYRAEHVEERAEYNAKWREDNPGYDAKWRLDNPEYGANWRENSDKYIAQLERAKEKITCDCGSIVSKGNYNRHCLSQKHINFNGRPVLANTSS